MDKKDGGRKTLLSLAEDHDNGRETNIISVTKDTYLDVSDIHDRCENILQVTRRISKEASGLLNLTVSKVFIICSLKLYILSIKYDMDVYYIYRL